MRRTKTSNRNTHSRKRIVGGTNSPKNGEHALPWIADFKNAGNQGLPGSGQLKAGG